VGLIGCGNIGAGAHAPAYAHIPQASVVAVCDWVLDRAEAVAAETGAEPYQDYCQLLARDDVDMVDLCVSTDQHAPLAVEALTVGKHVLCEKPMARSLAEADAMITAAQQTGRKLMIGHVRRFDHRYSAIKAALDAGDVGRAVYVRRAERQWLPFPADTWYWRPESGGGVILDIGVHITDLFHWYFGQTPLSVYAVGRQVRQAAREANSYDHVFMTYRFPDGAVGMAEASWAYFPDFGGGLYASLDIVGTEGRVQYSDQDSNPMLVFADETGAEFPRFFRFMSTTEHAFRAEIEHFVRCILNDCQPAIGLEDARAALEMVLAAQCSADSGQPVFFPLKGDAS
jgi:predicted dehydrogenase